MIEPAENVDYVRKNEFINAKSFLDARKLGTNSGDNQRVYQAITGNRLILH